MVLRRLSQHRKSINFPSTRDRGCCKPWNQVWQLIDRIVARRPHISLHRRSIQSQRLLEPLTSFFSISKQELRGDTQYVLAVYIWLSISVREFKHRYEPLQQRDRRSI